MGWERWKLSGVKEVLVTSEIFKSMSSPSFNEKEPATPTESSTSQPRLVVIMVGLPARGKTFIAQRLCHFLRWIGYKAKVFNFGSYRRTVIGQKVQKDFFDPQNPEMVALRRKMADYAIQDLFDFFDGDGEIGILDGTNSTRKRRKYIIQRLTAKNLQYLFVETICTIDSIIHQNIKETKVNSPDFHNLSPEEASKKFLARLKLYESAYQTIDSDSLPYIKLIDVGKKIILNQIQGYLHSRIVTYLMNLHTSVRPIWLSRHGQSEFNVEDRIGGDPPLTSAGKDYSQRLGLFFNQILQNTSLLSSQSSTSSPSFSIFGSLNSEEDSSPLDLSDINQPKLSVIGKPKIDSSQVVINLSSTVSKTCSTSSLPSVSQQPLLTQIAPVAVWTSTLTRTIQTAQHLPPSLPQKRWRALDELHAGSCENMTYKEIAIKYPHIAESRRKDKLRFRYPGPRGESYLDLILREAPVILELERQRCPILVIGHQATLRVIVSYFTGKSLSELPFVNIPLHTVLKLTPRAYSCKIEKFYLGPTPLDSIRSNSPTPSAAASIEPFDGALSIEAVETEVISLDPSNLHLS